MKIALVGFTGFVGSNLKEKYKFDDLYNSKNYKNMRNKEYNFLICAGISSSMWFANKNPQKDLENINNLLNVLITMKIKKLVFISTSAVYKQPLDGFNEESDDYEEDLPYGKNRRYAEEVIANNFESYNILRLPALFGEGLKKNFIYDLMNQEPAFIPEDKFNSILSNLGRDSQNILKKNYIYETNKRVYEFDKSTAEMNGERKCVLYSLKKTNSTSLNFTNSESMFQFYCIDNLIHDIGKAISNDIKILNICSESIKAKDIAKDLFNINCKNSKTKNQLHNNMTTIYSNKWGKDTEYQYSKDEVYADLKSFLRRARDYEIRNL